MKRRDFLKTSAATAGLVGTLTIEPMLAVAEGDPQSTSDKPGRRPRTIVRLNIFIACKGIGFCPSRRSLRDRIRFLRCRWPNGSGGRLCRSEAFAASRPAS